MSSDRKARVALALSILWISASVAPVMFARPQAIPAARIIENLKKRLKKTPDDHSLVYTLARVHYLVVANRTALIPGFGGDDSGRPAARHMAAGFLANLRYQEAGKRARKEMGLAPDARLDDEQRRQYGALTSKYLDQLTKADWVPDPLSRKQLFDHASTARRLFDRAIELAPAEALYHLGRASLAEQALQLGDSGKMKKLPGVSEELVRRQYLESFELAFSGELRRNQIPIAGLADLVSYEAGSAYLRLVGQKKEALTKDEKAKIVEVKKGLAKLRKMQRGPITPILVGHSPNTRLDELVDPARTVLFDLDGDGIEEAWPWVRPDTGILVWAPVHSVPIESGRQLFGSVTFFLFHRDGYAALRLLDDDQDGALRDLELDGIAIWYDRNGDGTSDPTELISAFDAGVDSIATSADGYDGRAPKSAAGVRYTDGRTVPSIDWVTERR